MFLNKQYIQFSKRHIYGASNGRHLIPIEDDNVVYS